MRQNIFLFLLLIGSASATFAITALPALLIPAGPMSADRHPSLMSIQQ